MVLDSYPQIGTVIGPYAKGESIREVFHWFNTGQTAAAAWQQTNNVKYVPFSIRETCTVSKLWWFNGATGRNVDIGIYNAAGTRLVNSGSTAQSGTSVWQVVTVTDTILVPGFYYMAMTVDGTATGTVRRNTSAVVDLWVYGVRDETPVSFGLPASATLTGVAQVGIPFIGGLTKSF